ncbi:glycosyl hydrolase family 28-related protein [Roseovarius salinarum]|uniref:glycosyl hydrolase family 28-related protein n=1 Tax=Roseovarius salinarum TaxID=1981892 RepID=UPI000C34C06F|nr:glycosyl hydrolase family 28-related protein [Roseovarius salinarum]
MNKAITDGVIFMPPAFADGLDVWSSGNGTPGSDTYENAANAAIVPADQDFGGALELVKTDAVQRLRYMGETPLLPGCYLRVRARVKAVSGNMPAVRIAAWAGGAGGVHVEDVTEVGPSTTLDTYGRVVEVSAIVGTGQRAGVDMVWGPAAQYGHFGLDLTGLNGGTVRVDDLIIEDVTHVFLREMMDWVDVRDYGALGDGVTDDTAAFEAADAAAQGGSVVVPPGSYHLADSVTMQAPTRFEGTVTMPDDKILTLTRNYHLPAYIDAFGDEELAFRKAFQALLSNADHESLDFRGRMITINEPIDMQAAVANRTTYAQRRHLTNGQISVNPGAAWDTEVVTSQASYSPTDPLTLSNVPNVANVPVGALVEGNGVGREVYVKARNVAAQELTLSVPLYDAAGTQTYTFRRFKFMLDFSGFEKLSKFAVSNMEFQCGGRCSGILLPTAGIGFHLRDCFVTKPKDRGVASHGSGDQGLLVDRCQFLSDENQAEATARTSIALNANAKDIKLRDNRVVRFRHFAVISGSSPIISGNHFFQGDGEPNGVRTAGLVIARTNARATIGNNYIDNCFIEWTNEHDQAPGFSSEFSFSGLSVTDNIFLAGHVAPWFKYIVVKPHGAGHFLDGVQVTGNSFRVIGDKIDRVDGVDTSFADLDYNRVANIAFHNNSFNLIENPVANPLVLKYSQNDTAKTWVIDCANKLPFDGWTQTVEAAIPAGPLRDDNNDIHFGAPYYETKQGPDRDRVKLQWERPVKGTAIVTIRIDDVF